MQVAKYLPKLFIHMNLYQKTNLFRIISPLIQGVSCGRPRPLITWTKDEVPIGDSWASNSTTVEFSEPGERTAVNLTLEPVKALILVRSVPEGATVEVAGANRGETPLLLTDLPLGQYRVRLAKSGFREQEVDVVVLALAPVKPRGHRQHVRG